MRRMEEKGTRSTKTRKRKSNLTKNKNKQTKAENVREWLLKI